MRLLWIVILNWKSTSSVIGRREWGLFWYNARFGNFNWQLSHLKRNVPSLSFSYSFALSLASAINETPRRLKMSPANKSRDFPPIKECRGGEYNSIAADLDGTLLLSRSSFPYFMLVAVEAGSLFRGLILLLSLPIVVISYLFVSESLGIQILIFIAFAGLKIRDIELVSRSVLPRYVLHKSIS